MVKISKSANSNTVFFQYHFLSVHADGLVSSAKVLKYLHLEHLLLPPQNKAVVIWDTFY